VTVVLVLALLTSAVTQASTPPRTERPAETPAVMAAAQDCEDLVKGGRQAYERRGYADAISAFESALIPCGANESLLLALAQSQLFAQRIPAALDTLERVLALNRDNVDALKVQARALYLAGRDADAERTLTTAATLAPADDEIAYDLGRVYYQQNRYSEATAQFQRAIALNPQSHKAYDNLGLATEALGDVPQALRHYLKAIELVHTDHPGYDVVYANLADLMLKLGEYRKAFDLAAEAAQRNPDDARNLFLTGKALVKLERLDLSLKWLERAVVVNPSYPEPRYVLAHTYRRLGRAADAEQQLKAFQEAQAHTRGIRR
jgi:tetratricopeptide (TPR) repeat protein